LIVSLQTPIHTKTFWFNEEGEVIERTGEEPLSQEMNFTWPALGQKDKMNREDKKTA